jgi:hypothetical protein
MRHVVRLVGLLGALSGSALGAETTIDLSASDIPDHDFRHFSIEFEVPAGIKEIAVDQESLELDNVLDFGIMDPSGAWRGWGGSRIKQAIVGEQAATRSHVPGALPAGTWQIVVGQAKVKKRPAPFKLIVSLRDTPTLPPQTERKAYTPPPPLVKETRWYAGDFHVHSIESNDAQPPLSQIATFARSVGLDFAHISDHNIHTQLDFYADAQAAHPDFLFLPGVEYTTYWGHAGAIGAMEWVDDRTELPGRGILEAVQRFREQGALFSINHPTLTSDLGKLGLADQCIGCDWEHDVPLEYVDAVEIRTGKSGLLGDSAIEFWDALSARGRHLAALGGSDDHKGGEGTGVTDSPIGNPTTLVFASELSVQAILAGIRAGRTVVKLEGPDDPMIDLSASFPPEGDTLRVSNARLVAVITGGEGFGARWVKNGEAQAAVEIDADPFELAIDVTAPSSGEDRWRAEVVRGERPRTVTSHLWIPASAKEEDSGCGCRMGTKTGAGIAWTAASLLALLGIWLRKRRA